VKSIRKNAPILAFVSVFVLAGLLLTMSAGLSAQTTATSTPPNPINPPPFDFNDAFYTVNGIEVTQLNSAAAGRFGFFRLTGPPAGPGQVNWVVDNSNTDPTRKNIRILATTGGYRDSDGSPTQFISIIAFLLNQNFFTGVQNARGIKMIDIVSNFEAYAGLKQTLSDGTIAPQPCGTMGDGLTPCFPVTSVATPNLRQDWRFATNRTRLDGSAPFGYFCDDILGMWIITYFWYTQFVVGGRPGVTPTANCNKVLAALAAANGTNLDGTPIIHTGDELNFLEGKSGFTSSPIPGLALSDEPPTTAPCAAEGNENQLGADGGAVWIICPAIPDPTQGGIAPDAFLDSVHLPNGKPLDQRITDQFNCLQHKGTFCKK